MPLRRRQLHPTLAWKIPWIEEPGRLQSMGSLRVGLDWVTLLSLFTFIHWRRKWQPTLVFLPGESRGRGSQVAAVYGVTQSWTRLKWLSIAILHCVYVPQLSYPIICWRTSRLFYFSLLIYNKSFPKCSQIVRVCNLHVLTEKHIIYIKGIYGSQPVSPRQRIFSIRYISSRKVN